MPIIYNDLHNYSEAIHTQSSNVSLSAISDANDALNNILILMKSHIELIPWEEKLVIAYMKSFKFLQAGFMEIAQNARRNQKNYVIESQVITAIFEIYAKALDLVDDKLDKKTSDSCFKAHSSLHDAFSIYYRVILGDKFPGQ